MRTTTLLLASIIAASTAMATSETSNAEDMQGHMGGMMQGGKDRQATGHGMMRGGTGHETMCPMMRSGMMQGGMTGSEMMGSGMMHGGMMSSEMMDSGMMPGGAGALFGSRVRPVMNLSADDVRGYLTLQLERLNNKRLKIGDINSGDATITADIVTVDNSLVQRLKVDRHTGAITYEN